VLVNADETTGRATSINRLSLSTRDIEALVAQPTAPR
jgi:hypothetical protein